MSISNAIVLSHATARPAQNECQGGPLKARLKILFYIKPLVTDVELGFAFKTVPGFPFPLKQPNGSWLVKPLNEHFERPTLSKLLANFRFGFAQLVRLFRLDRLRGSGLNRPELNILYKGGGLYIRILRALRRQLTHDLLNFTRLRPLRNGSSEALLRPKTGHVLHCSLCTCVHQTLEKP